MTALLRFLSKDGEPLRHYVYGIVGPALALAVVLGLLTGEQATAILAVAAAALLVPAVETARRRVTPYNPEDSDPEYSDLKYANDLGGVMDVEDI